MIVLNTNNDIDNVAYCNLEKKLGKVWNNVEKNVQYNVMYIVTRDVVEKHRYNVRKIIWHNVLLDLYIHTKLK